MNESEFNQKYPVGTPVRYHPVIGQPEFVETETRSEAWTLGSGHVVVSVKGKAGGVSIASLEAVEHSVHPTVCQCGEDCIPMLGEDTCVRCDLPLAHSG